MGSLPPPVGTVSCNCPDGCRSTRASLQSVVTCMSLSFLSLAVLRGPRTDPRPILAWGSDGTETPAPEKHSRGGRAKQSSGHDDPAIEPSGAVGSSLRV